MTALPDVAAFVADVFSTAYSQGPSLPYSTRSTLLTMFKNDTAMWRTRLQAALQIVGLFLHAQPSEEAKRMQLGCGVNKGMPDQETVLPRRGRCPWCSPTSCSPSGTASGARASWSSSGAGPPRLDCWV